MSFINQQSSNGRRRFLSSLSAGAAALGMAQLAVPVESRASDKPSFTDPGNEADAWFNKVKGKHRVIFDCTKPNGMMPFAWPKVFLMTNGITGTKATDCGVVVVLRHEAIPFAFENRIWETYKFGEVFKYDDPVSNAPATRNPFWEPKPGDFKVPGVGEVQIGINELQDSGVMFCVCNMAITVFTSALADGMKMDAQEIRKDWMSGLLPGIQPVPSGVWAVGRAQEHGCAYVYAG